jgi:hypothetical protein
MVEVNIYKSKHTIINAKGWCSGKGSPWEHQGHGIDSHQQPYILGLSKWYLVICGIFYGSSCGDSIPVENGSATYPASIQSSRHIEQVSLTESSSQTYKYVMIRQLEYLMRIAPISVSVHI